MSDLAPWTEVLPVGDLLLRSALLHGERDALVFPDSRITYKALLRRSIDVARALIAKKIRPGEHVGLLMNNCIEFAEGFFGIVLAGAIAVPLNARHKANELTYIIENADLVAILTNTAANDYIDFGDVLAAALSGLTDADTQHDLDLTAAQKLRFVAILNGLDRKGFIGPSEFHRLASLTEDAQVYQTRQQVSVRDIALIVYTSGTTAHPKGCLLSHEAVTRGPSERARFRLCTGDHDVTWASGPLFHIGSLAPFIGSVAAGGTCLADAYFDAGRALELMSRERVTLAWPWFSAIVQALLDHPSFNPDSLESLRYLFMIAPASVVRRIQSLLPQTEMLQACGMTETAGVFALSNRTDSAETRVNTQGKAAAGLEIKIRDLQTNGEAPPGETGEILVRGYNVMSGYYKDPVKTAAALDADGWLHTGDLYSKLADGNVMFAGRLKDMLKVGGENVSAVEVEAFLCEHPAVKLAEVVGQPDPRLEEVPVAFVELREGIDVSAEGLIAFCQGRIAKYKIPRAVYFMRSSEWPMSATKVDKQRLKQMLK